MATILLATEMSKERLQGREFEPKPNFELEWRDDLNEVLKVTPKEGGFRIESRDHLTFALTMMGAKNKSYTAFLSEEAYRLWGGGGSERNRFGNNHATMRTKLWRSVLPSSLDIWNSGGSFSIGLIRILWTGKYQAN